MSVEDVVVLSHPFLRALSCCLIPQGWLPGESQVLAPLSPDGRRWRFFVASLLEDVVLASPSQSLLNDWCKHVLGVGLVLVVRAFFWAISSVFLCWYSGGRSGVSLLPVLCVGVVGV
uniref:Uncharacterized protein n=1 Tax=Oryza glumipatula TaxID=40148 RepID=A0A0E0A0F7_9ORYZ